MKNRKQLQKYYIVFCMAIIIGIGLSACQSTDTITSPINNAPLQTNTVQETTLKLHSRIPVANIQVPDREYIRFFHNFNRVIPNMTQFLYSYFADDFDFIFFSYNEDSPYTGLDFFGEYHAVKNDVLGIGEELYDNTSQYGSAGRLQGIIHFPYRTGITDGPGLHEIMHRWGNYVLPTYDGFHWGFSSAGGQLGGFDLDKLVPLNGNRYRASVAEFDGFGFFANGGNSVPYSPIELYLAGLLPASEVPDTHVATNSEWLGGSEFSADGFEIYSVERIIEEHGARVPSFANSQKQFRVLFVVLSTRDLTDNEWEEVGRVTSEFGFAGEDKNPLYNFWEATSGRATMQFGGTAESLIRDPDTPDNSEPDISASNAVIISSSIIGTWSYTYPNSVSEEDLISSYIFEENGMYSSGGYLASYPFDIADTGTYSIISDSLLRQCIENLSGFAIDPPACSNRSYSIVNQTLTLGAADFYIGPGTIYDETIYRPQETLIKEPPQSIVGTWERTHFETGLKLIATYNENGNYSEMVLGDSDPSSMGTYRNISDSAIQLCLTRVGNMALNPQVCFEAPYRIIGNTLILEPVRIVFANGPTYIPELKFIRQINN